MRHTRTRRPASFPPILKPKPQQQTDCEPGNAPAVESANHRSLDCAVVIPCHNYGRYLGECLDSVLCQTWPATEILVIDDNSTDNTAEVAKSYEARGVKYRRVANRSVYRNRILGMTETKAATLIFLDADDILPPRYIESATKVMQTDPGIGIVYTDFELFGDFSGRHVLEEKPIERMNYIHCASLVRRAAMQSVDWPYAVAIGFSHEDWFMWRKILRLGWRVGKSDVPLHYRKHGTSMMAQGNGKHNYFQYSNLQLETVQIVLPLSGRHEWLPRLQTWVEMQSWKNISVIVTDTSPDPEFRQRVKDWLSTLHCETAYIPLPPTGAVASLERRGQPETCHIVQQLMPQIYSQIVQRLSQEYIMWVEDDVLPPLDAIERLMWDMADNVACVSGVVVSRFNGNLIGWDKGFHVRTTRNRGIEQLGGTGFGCLLIRRSILQKHPMHAGGVTHNYDQEFAVDMESSGMKWLIDWDILCNHAGIPAESLPLYGTP